MTKDKNNIDLILYMRDVILKNIRIIRENADLSQEQQADKMGFTQSKYARFEDGRTKTDLETLIKFASSHNMNLLDLILYPKKYKEESYQSNKLEAFVSFKISDEKAKDLLLQNNLDLR